MELGNLNPLSAPRGESWESGEELPLALTNSQEKESGWSPSGVVGRAVGSLGWRHGKAVEVLAFFCITSWFPSVTSLGLVFLSPDRILICQVFSCPPHLEVAASLVSYGLFVGFPCDLEMQSWLIFWFPHLPCRLQIGFGIPESVPPDETFLSESPWYFLSVTSPPPPPPPPKRR